MDAQRLALWLQYAGLALSMAGGAPWPRPNWLVVIGGLAVVALGIVWKRSADKRDPRLAEGAHGEGGPARTGSVQSAREALPVMLTKVRALIASIETAKLGDVAATIETLQQNGTEAVAAAQDALVRAYSFPGYSTVMTPLATGERWLYRAWSAASDGHRPEVIASLNTALPYLEEAQTALEKLGTEKKAG